MTVVALQGAAAYGTDMELMRVGADAVSQCCGTVGRCVPWGWHGANAHRRECGLIDLWRRGAAGGTAHRECGGRGCRAVARWHKHSVIVRQLRRRRRCDMLSG